MYFNITTVTGKKSNISIDEFHKEEDNTYEEDEKLKENFLKEFKKFYNPNSSSLAIDFIVYNRELRYYCPIIIILKTDNFGNTFSIDSKPLEIELDLTKFSKYLNASLFFFIITCFLITHFTYYNISYALKIALAHYIKKKGEKDVLSKTSYSIYDFIKALFILCFSDVITTFITISYVMNLILIGLYINCNFLILSNIGILVQQEKRRNIVLDFQFSYDMIKIAYEIELFRYLYAFCCLFMFLRLTENFKNFFQTISEYIEGFKNALTDILSFFTIFLLIISGISIVQWIYFSTKIKGFNSFWDSMINNIFFSIGSKKDIVSEMVETDSLYGLIYVLCVLYLIKYGLIMLLVSIIIYSFEHLVYIVKNKFIPTTMEKLIKDESGSINFYYMNISKFFDKKTKNKKLMKKNDKNDKDLKEGADICSNKSDYLDKNKGIF